MTITFKLASKLIGNRIVEGVETLIGISGEEQVGRPVHEIVVFPSGQAFPGLTRASGFQSSAGKLNALKRIRKNS